MRERVGFFYASVNGTIDLYKEYRMQITNEAQKLILFIIIFTKSHPLEIDEIGEYPIIH